MALSDWFRPPRHLFLLFSGVTLVPVAVLVWLGWQVVDQDRQLEKQRQQKMVADAADRIISALTHELSSVARELPAWTANPPALGDATVVRIGDNGVVSQGGIPLVFTSGRADHAEPPASLWAAAEELEVRQKDVAGAARAFRALARSSDPDVRAGALLRLAGTQRTSGDITNALVTYRALAGETTARVMGEPADLIARATACQMLANLGRRDELAREATTLATDLASGRWPIDRATYEFRTDQLRQWTTPQDSADAIALSSAVVSFETRRAQSAGRAGYAAETHDGRSVLLIWTPDRRETLVLAATPAFVERMWGPIWEAERVAVSLVNAEGQRVIGPAPNAGDALRSAADTGLPWTVRVSGTASSADASTAAERTRFIAAGLVVLGLLLPTGGYVVWRAVQKELAVARLQADFVSAVSHEFRTPLTSMAHLTERLQRDAALTDDRRRQYYDTLARETQRLRRFVETLLDFGRMEAGEAPTRLQLVDLATVVKDVLTEFAADPVRGTTHVSFVPNGSVPVRVDRESFGSAVWNLLDNAAKYSPPASPIEVTMNQRRGRAVVSVRDHGPGVPVSERRRIFRKFVRGASQRDSGVRGTGVGLAMVSEIVRMHGGGVSLESELGHGSTFSLWLPVADAVAHGVSDG